MSDLATNAALIVATMDLQVVKLLRSAIRTADLSAARGRCERAERCDRHRRRIHQTPYVEPRRIIHQTPLLEPRRVERAQTCGDVIPATLTYEPSVSHITPSPIQPPWKTVPWKNSEPPAKVVKVVMRRPDNLTKGSIIDCFV